MARAAWRASPLIVLDCCIWEKRRRGSHGMILHEIMWRTSGRANAGTVARAVRGATCRGNRCQADCLTASQPAWLPGWLPGLVRIGLGCFIQLVFRFLFLYFCLSFCFLLSQICDETGTVNCGNLCCQRPSVSFPRYNSLDFQFGLFLDLIQFFSLGCLHLMALA